MNLPRILGVLCCTSLVEFAHDTTVLLRAVNADTERVVTIDISPCVNSLIVNGGTDNNWVCIVIVAETSSAGMLQL